MVLQYVRKKVKGNFVDLSIKKSVAAVLGNLDYWCLNKLNDVEKDQKFFGMCSTFDANDLSKYVVVVVFDDIMLYATV